MKVKESFLNKSGSDRASAQLKFTLAIAFTIIASALLISNIHAIVGTDTPILVPGLPIKGSSGSGVPAITPMSQPEPTPMSIDTCGEPINGTYTIGNDITGCAGDGVVINASNMVLDCNGHWINATGTANSGIKVNGYNNVTIKNCKIAYFENSTWFNSTNNSQIINNTMILASRGIHLFNSNFNNLTDNNITGEPTWRVYGIFLESKSNNNTILHNSMSGFNQDYYGSVDIENSDYNNVINNTMVSGANGMTALTSLGTVIDGNNISYNTVGANSQKGLYIRDGSNYTTVKNNYIVGNGKYGIYVLNANNINNAIYHNNIYGNPTNNVYSPVALEVSNGSQGNFWNRSSCPVFNATNDSNAANVIDSYPYNALNGWLTSSPSLCSICGDTITSSGTLAQDLTGCPANGLVINANNVVLDCAGHSISGDYAGSSENGVFIPNTVNNVTVRNCTVYGFNGSSSTGIAVDGGNAHKIIYNTLYDDYYGIHKTNLYSGSNNVISDNVVLNTSAGSSAGIFAQNAVNITIERNKVYRSNSKGILVTSGCTGTVKSNTVNNTTVNCFDLQSFGGSVENNTASYSAQDYGMFITAGSDLLVRNNTIFNNNYTGKSGIYINTYSANVNITENNIYGNNIGITYDIGSGPLFLYHNNIYNNTNYQVSSSTGYELSNGGQGNYWGHNVCPVFNATNDSNAANVVDSHAYNTTNGWLTTTPANCIACEGNIAVSTTLSANLVGCAGNGLSITAPNVVLDCAGHSIGGDYNPGSSYGILISANNATIKNCTIYGFNSWSTEEAGIWIQGDSHTITNNTFYDNLYTMRSASDSPVNNVLISDNTVLNTTGGYGIFLYGTGNIIKNNKISNIFDSTHVPPHAIRIYRSSNSTVLNNTINNTAYGIFFDENSTSGPDAIENNTISNSMNASIHVENGASQYTNQLTVRGNSIYTIINGYGIDVSANLQNAQILNNTINSSYMAGINMIYAGGLIANNTIKYASGGNGFGIYLNTNKNLVIQDNIIAYNANVGLMISSGSATGKTIFHNNIYNNSGTYQIWSIDAIELSNNSQGNYWGRSDCPLFIPGFSANNDTNVIDSYPYNTTNGWLTYPGTAAVCAAPSLQPNGVYLNDSDIFYSNCSGNNIIHLVANLTQVLPAPTVTANFSEVEGNASALVNMTDAGNGVYTANYTISNVANAMFSPRTIIVTAQNTMGGTGNGTAAVLYNMTNPMPDTPCQRSGAGTTNFCDVTNFSNVNFIQVVELNGSAACTTGMPYGLPWGARFQKVAVINFTNPIDFSDPNMPTRMGALAGAIVPYITPSGQFGDSYIYVDAAAFDAVSPASVTMYGLPFTNSPAILNVSGSGGASGATWHNYTPYRIAITNTPTEVIDTSLSGNYNVIAAFNTLGGQISKEIFYDNGTISGCGKFEGGVTARKLWANESAAAAVGILRHDSILVTKFPYSHILVFSSIDTINHNVGFVDYATGQLLTQSYSTGSGGGCSAPYTEGYGQIMLDGYNFKFCLNTTGADPKMVLDMNSNDTFNDAVVNPIYTAKGAKILLTCPNGTSGSKGIFNVYEEKNNTGADYENYANWTYGYIPSNATMQLGSVAFSDGSTFSQSGPSTYLGIDFYGTNLQYDVNAPNEVSMIYPDYYDNTTTYSAPMPNSNLVFTVGHFSQYNMTDNQTPTITINSPTFAVTSVNTVLVNVTVNGTGTQLSSISALVNGTQVFSYNQTQIFQNCTNNTPNFDVVTCAANTSALGDGNYLLTVIARDFGDGNGNQNTANATFAVDANAPIISISAPPNATYTNNTTTVFTFVPTDAIGIKNCTVTLQGVNSPMNVPNTNTLMSVGGNEPDVGCSSSTITNTTTVINGVPNVIALNTTGLSVWCQSPNYHYIVNVSCINNGTVMGNNTNNAVAFDFVVPTFVIISPPTNQSNYSSSTVNLSFSATESNVALAYVNLDGITTPYNYTNPVSNTIPLTGLVDGSHQVTLTLTDLAGNTNTSGTYYFTVDTKAPDISNVSTTAIRATWSTISYTVTDAGIGVANSTVFYSTDGSTYTPVTNVTAGNGMKTLNLTGLSAGTQYYYQVSAVDSLSNTAPNTTIKTFATTATVAGTTNNTTAVTFNVNTTINGTNTTMASFDVQANNTTEASISVSTVSDNPTGTNLSIPALNKYFNVTETNISSILQWVIIKIYYDVSDIPTGVDENSLRLYWYNGTSGAWEQLPGGVNTTDHYVWGNSTHFSMFSIGGILANGQSCTVGTQCSSGICCNSVCASSCGTSPGGSQSPGAVPGTPNATASMKWIIILPGSTITMPITNAKIFASEIKITVLEAATNVLLKANALDQKPATVTTPAGEVYGYLEITATGLDNSNIKEAKIKFKVPNSFFDKVPETGKIVLQRFVNGGWTELNTTMLSQDSNYTYYEAKTPGFSVFAITYKTGVTTPTQPPTQPVQQPSTQPSIIPPITIPAEAKSSIIYIIIGIAILAVLVYLFFLPKKGKR